VAAAAERAPDWGAALAQHSPWLIGLISRLTGDRALAQDLVQEAYLKALASHGPREPDKLRSWLASIAVNAARDAARKTSRTREIAAGDQLGHGLSDETPDPQEALLQAEMSSCIAEFVDKLPAPQRQVVALHDLIGFSHGEIAERLGVSKANSRVLLHRGRAQLHKLFEGGCVLTFDGDAMPCERKAKGEAD
jgi:RNA polymerase sigma-70 factor (ECF subfamily)